MTPSPDQPSRPLPAPTARVVRAEVTEAPISVTELADAVQDAAAGAVVVGSPSRGVTYLGLVADVELVYPTRVHPMAGSAELDLARAAPDPSPGSATCDLVKRLGAQYYVSVERDPAGLRYGNASLRWDDRLAAWSTRGMELVSWADTGRGAVALWRITACG